MSAETATVPALETTGNIAPKEGPPPEKPAHTDVLGEAKTAVQGIVQNRPMQVGLGVAAAAGAGLLLVSLVGAGAAAVAGAAGYLAYRELSEKRK